MKMRVRAVADDQMPAGVEWAVVETEDGVVWMLVRASTTTRCEESQRLLNQALARAS